jgi:nucleotide-binding universal stress UspA family protein
MATILFAYDGSEESQRALRYAGRLGEGDTVRVIAVTTGLWEGPRTTDYTDPTIDPDEQRRALDEARELLAATGAAVDVIATVGNPADEILRAAEAHGVELIVIGRRGQHAVARFLMGSVADRVVRHATCDVLVVR